MEHLVIIEKGKSSWGAYVPDLPGCVAVAQTQDKAMTLIREAIEMHLEDMHEQGKVLPKANSKAVKITTQTRIHKPEQIMAKNEQTSKSAAKSASKTLKDPSTSKKSKSAAGSALSQHKAPEKVTSAKVAKDASKVLKDGRTAKDSKSAAGSALTQKPSTKKK